MGDGSLDRSRSGPYDSLQRTKILNSIRIKGESIEKLELRSGTGEGKTAYVPLFWVWVRIEYVKII